MSRVSNRGFVAIISFLLITLALVYQLSKHPSPDSFLPTVTGRLLALPELAPSSNSGKQRRAWPSTPPASQEEEWERSAKLALAAEAQNVSVHFWGKVVDQEGALMAGVAVKARIRHWQLEGRQGVGTRFMEKAAVSGGDGRFEISGATGDVLTFEALEKEGYEAEPTALRSFGYNISTNIQTDPNNPMEMRIWRTSSREPVLTGEQFFGIIPDGRLYTIDLVKGIHLESGEAEGDLRVWVKRPLDATFGQKYDWSFQIIPINGGLMEVWDDVYLAPSSGYSAEYAHSRSATDDSWGDTVRKQFVLKTRAGQLYGRVRLQIFGAYSLHGRDGAIGIRSVVNPAGSRKLF